MTNETVRAKSPHMAAPRGRFRSPLRGPWLTSIFGAVLLAVAGTASLRGIMGPSVSILFFPAVLFTAIYFGYFVFLWAYTTFGWETTKPVPDRVTTHD